MEQLQTTIIKVENETHFFSLLFIDIDGLKAVNDTNGYDVGDKLFKALHNVLVSLLGSMAP